MPEIEDKTKFP